MIVFFQGSGIVAPASINLQLGPLSRAHITNTCTGTCLSGNEIIASTTTSDFPNDDALRTLSSGEADAMWVYADEAERLACSSNDGDTPWD